jgi:hypothetical protein
MRAIGRSGKKLGCRPNIKLVVCGIVQDSEPLRDSSRMMGNR